MTIRNVAVAATTLTAALVLAGCGSTGSGSTGGAEPPASAPSAAQAAHNAADVAFAQGMIPHHAQAVEMSGLAATRAGSGEVRDLAAGIGRAQEPEIGQMRGFLAAWGAPETPAGDHGGMAGMAEMSGMMDDGQMGRLAAASGPAFDRMFLQTMIAHHEGAVQMAGTELTGGADPRAWALAQRIVDTQRSEIDRMRRLLG